MDATRVDLERVSQVVSEDGHGDFLLPPVCRLDKATSPCDACDCPRWRNVARHIALDKYPCDIHSGRGMDTYGQRLSKVLDSKSLSLRQLAHLMNPRQPESARRKLTRIMGGAEPHERTRAEIAAALGVDRREIEGDDEDEDIEAMVAVLFGQVGELKAHANHLLRVVGSRKQRAS